jgi:GNAT superfamily N-acetyltransferase
MDAHFNEYLAAVAGMHEIYGDSEDGRPVGHLHWVPRGEIDSIVVHPELQRRGIGSAMLDHAHAHPDQYPSTYPVHHSQHLSTAGRAWAAAHGHTPPEETIYKADDNPDNWGFTAVDKYTPLTEPYNGQNEDEMSRYLEQPWTPKTAASADGDGWPVWWRGKTRPDVDFDDRWSPNHPQRIPAPWDR